MKNWKWLYLLTIISALMMFCFVNIREGIRPPSVGWSRALSIATYEGLDQYESWAHRYVALTTDIEEKRHYLLMRGLKDETPVLRVLGFDGSVIGEHMVSGLDSMPDKAELYFESGDLKLIALQRGRIHHMTLGKDGQITGNDLLEPTDVRDVLYLNGNYIFTDGSGFGHIGKNDLSHVGKEIEGMDFLTDSGDQAIVLRREGSGRVLEIYDLNDGLADPKVIRLSGDMMMSYGHLDGYQAGDMTGVIVEIKDTKNAMNTVYHYNVAGGKDFEVARGSQAFSPMVQKNASGNPILLMTVNQSKGQSVSPNVASFSINDLMAGKNEKLTYLTRTDENSEVVDYGTDGVDSWLFSIEKNSRSETLVLSGNTGQLVSNTSRVVMDDIEKAMSALLFMCLPTLLAGFIPIINIFVPVFVLLALASFFSLERMERNYKKAILYAVVGHIVLKFYFTYKAILWNDQFADITTVMPFFLNSWIAILITLLATTALSVRIARLRMPVLSKGDCFGFYGAFAFIDLSIYTLLVMPYYYSYLALPIFYS